MGKSLGRLFTGESLFMNRYTAQGPAEIAFTSSFPGRIVARALNRKVKTSLSYEDPSIPPIGKIEGIDLVTEGVLTMTRTAEILREYRARAADADYFRRLFKKYMGITAKEYRQAYCLVLPEEREGK